MRKSKARSFRHRLCVACPKTLLLVVGVVPPHHFCGDVYAFAACDDELSGDAESLEP